MNTTWRCIIKITLRSKVVQRLLFPSTDSTTFWLSTPKNVTLIIVIYKAFRQFNNLASLPCTIYIVYINYVVYMYLGAGNGEYIL